jgi:hypothetical protein
MQLMTITPETEYYTFNCVGGSLRKPSGAPWFPHNPNYDPGPLPPPKPRKNKERKKEKQPSTGDMTADGQSQGSLSMVAGSSTQSVRQGPKSSNERLPNRFARHRRRRSRPSQAQLEAPNQSLPQFSPHERHPPQSMAIDRA